MSAAKNTEREAYSFANINLMGRCNCDCFYCLGKDLPDRKESRSLATHFNDWIGFREFLDHCTELGITKLYLTGLDTDPLLYPHLEEIIPRLQLADRFTVGLRTNGFALYGPKHIPLMRCVNECRDEVGYSITSLTPAVQKMICGVSAIPDWDAIIKDTRAPCRVSIVVNRCNQHEVLGIVRQLAPLFPRYLRYIQLRRVSTDHRIELLQPDINAYEQLYTYMHHAFERTDRLWGDADVFNVSGIPVVCWRTVKTTVNSINYFTDGTSSDSYFIIEGYQRANE